jgi:hypothetical protein
LIPVASRSRNGMDAVDLNAIGQNLLHEPDHAYKEQHYGFRFRELNNPQLYLDDIHRQILTTYRQAFLTLAMHCVYDEKPDFAKADLALNTMNAKIPHEIFPMQYELLYQTSTLYQSIGDTSNFRKYSAYTIASCDALMENPGLKGYIDQRFPPRELMIELYDKRGDYADALALLNMMIQQAQHDPQQQELIRKKIYELQIKDLERQKKYTDAIDIAGKALASINDTTDHSSLMSRQNFEQLLNTLRQKAGLPVPNDTASTLH